MLASLLRDDYSIFASHWYRHMMQQSRRYIDNIIDDAGFAYHEL